MTTTADPAEILTWFTDMRQYWCEAELDALYGVSLAEQRRQISPKMRRRADARIALNLSRTTTRATELQDYLELGYGPPDIIADILRRIANAEASWRKMLAIMRATPILPDADNFRRAIASPVELPGWLLKLDEWARPEAEVIADLKLSIAREEPRADEALDHLQWSAEDDLEAIALVLRLSTNWHLATGTREQLLKASSQASAQLNALIALTEQARPFSMEVWIAKELAELAKARGHKPN
jgi:hypothetical protein